MELRVGPGCVIGFIGSNGADKTTTIKLILGLLSPDAGNIQLFGATVDPNEYDLEIRQGIGAVFDSCPFPPEVRVSTVRAIGRQTMSACIAAMTPLAMKSGMTKGVRFAPLAIMLVFLAGTTLLGNGGVLVPYIPRMLSLFGDSGMGAVVAAGAVCLFALVLLAISHRVARRLYATRGF